MDADAQEIVPQVDAELAWDPEDQEVPESGVLPAVGVGHVLLLPLRGEDCRKL